MYNRFRKCRLSHLLHPQPVYQLSWHCEKLILSVGAAEVMLLCYCGFGSRDVRRQHLGQNSTRFCFRIFRDLLPLIAQARQGFGLPVSPHGFVYAREVASVHFGTDTVGCLHVDGGGHWFAQGRRVCFANANFNLEQKQGTQSERTAEMPFA
jgi:hypothetical protein